MKRLFYLNLTFSCNNNCIFCISHNTKNGKEINYSFDEIKKAAEYFKFSEDDGIILSGGEPTLCPFFEQIVEFLTDKIGNIIVYTNGTHNIFHKPNVRWIFSLYGGEKTHSYFTRNTKAFGLLLDNLEKNHTCNIELKVILNPLISKQEILDLMDLKVNFKLKGFHISCLCDSYNDLEKRSEFLLDKVKIIQENIEKNNSLKLSNIPFCIDKGLFNSIDKLSSTQDENISEYVILLHSGHRLFNYNQLHNWSVKCLDCSLRYYCRDTNLSYRVLGIEKDKKKLIGE